MFTAIIILILGKSEVDANIPYLISFLTFCFCMAVGMFLDLLLCALAWQVVV
jgi:hypothetical protein